LAVKEGAFIASKPTGVLGVVKTFEIVVPKLVANGTKLLNANDELAEKNGSGGAELIAAVLGGVLNLPILVAIHLIHLTGKLEQLKLLAK
jgi:hypothetical protein